MIPLYRDFTSQEEIDAEYNLALTVPDIDSRLRNYAEKSKIVRKEIACVLDVKYGPTSDETVDIFPAKKGAPLFLFIHGGYWVRCCSKDFSYLAAGLVNHGISVAVGNYSLCPQVSISEITRQNRALVAWLHQKGDNFGIDPSNIVVAGHSAGGQQVGMIVNTDWQGVYGLPDDIIKRGVTISGVFNLTPLYYSYLQPKLQLTHKLIMNQSPQLHIRKSKVPLFVCVGEKETSEFHRQTNEFLQAWRDKGNPGKRWVGKGKNHFSIIESLYLPGSSFCRAIVDFVR